MSEVLQESMGRQQFQTEGKGTSCVTKAERVTCLYDWNLGSVDPISEQW